MAAVARKGTCMNNRRRASVHVCRVSKLNSTFAPIPTPRLLPCFHTGFLNDSNAKRAKGSAAAAAGSSSYRNVGKGQKEAGPAAVAAARSAAAGATAVPPGAAGTSCGSHPYYHMPDSYYGTRGAQKGRQQPKEPKERAQDQSQKQQQWQQQKKKQPKPAPAPPAPGPIAPAEVVTINEGLAVIQQEREEARRKLQMQRAQETDLKAQPIGRCCLNRGLDGSPQWCHKDKWHALVGGLRLGLRAAEGRVPAFQLTTARTASMLGNERFGWWCT